MPRVITTEEVSAFLNGRDSMERIVSIECDYKDDEASIIFVNEKGNKVTAKEPFMPFVWAKHSVAVRMCNGDRDKLKSLMRSYGIWVKELKYRPDSGEKVDERLENGYKFMFYAKRKMNYSTFLKFFRDAGTPVYSPKRDSDTKSKEFMAVTPVEQFMISTGKRLFKGYSNYDDLKRMQFDLETQGLNPEIHGIDQIGIRTNKGLERVISVEGEGKERLINEYHAIIEFFRIIRDECPDIIAGHNSENFDWSFIFTRLEVLGTNIETVSKLFFTHPIYKRKNEVALKLGGEVEYYKPTVMWGTNIVDSLHAVRRKQAIDSNMKLANLKYVTKYLDLNKENRVYVDGGKIGTIWRETDEHSYAFNDSNGQYYKISETNPIKEGFEYKSGRYIVERYLLDDIWETDKVECKLNEPNFLLAKIIPTTFQRVCTMGTASIWKLIVLAWCYENDLAVPNSGENRKFTGGLSRLNRVGFVKNVAKLDYNSLYPSIILTWNIKTPLDISDVLLAVLNYILTYREHYKALKKKAGKASNKIREILEKGDITSEERIRLIAEKKKYDAEEKANDNSQMVLKLLGNSFFGSYASVVFPMSDLLCAEKTTCIGRMLLRLMISHFQNKLGYLPVVGDSFTSDTPIFLKYKKSGIIDIKPISEIIDKKCIEKDALGREYDHSNKDFQVLCRSGWHDVEYVYRHKTNKPIYHVKDNDMEVDVTEDHSLFDESRTEIKPSEIKKGTKLEYYKSVIKGLNEKADEKKLEFAAKMLSKGLIRRIPTFILNATDDDKKKFINLIGRPTQKWKMNKTLMAGLQFIGYKFNN